MALLTATTRIQPTRSERLALSVAVAISDVVASRIERRRAHLERTATAADLSAAAAAGRTAHREQAHRLGLR
jgi:hypothetical protein